MPRAGPTAAGCPTSAWTSPRRCTASRWVPPGRASPRTSWATFRRASVPTSSSSTATSAAQHPEACAKPWCARPGSMAGRCIRSRPRTSLVQAPAHPEGGTTIFRRPALLLAAVLAIGQAQAADPAERGLLVDLGGVPDAARVEALKHSDGTDWWLEAGEVLLLVGNTARLRQSVPAQLVLREVDNIRPDRLAVRPRGCIDHRQPLAGRDLLLVGDKWDLVNRPVSFAPAGLDAGQINPHLGLPEFVPVERNSVLARLHPFDRPERLP